MYKDFVFKFYKKNFMTENAIVECLTIRCPLLNQRGTQGNCGHDRFGR